MQESLLLICGEFVAVIRQLLAMAFERRSTDFRQSRREGCVIFD
jgi:hypothetical protein